MAPQHRLVRLLWCAAAAAALLLVVRAFVGDVRRVESASMEPTLLEGEWVFVRFDASAPVRGELVVARPRENAGPVVKRVAGLPGESVRLVAGDLLVSGVAPASAAETWIAVEDSEREAIEARWRGGGQWTRLERGVRGDADSPVLELAAIDDGWLRADGVRATGPNAAADTRLDFELAWSGPRAEFAAALHVRGDVYEARLVRDGARADARLSKGSNAPRAPAEAGAGVELAHAVLEATEGPRAWSLRVRDGVVSLLLDGEPVLSAPAGPSRLHHADRLQEGGSYPPRATLRFVAGAGELSRVAVWRDLHWQPAGAHAVERALDLGPDQCFLLGDASFQSRDGREWGPTPLSALVGRPAAVVWPPSGWRRLP